MIVGLVTNWDERCAVAEYAKHLADYCLRHSTDVEFKIVTGLLNYEGVEAQTRDVDVIHFNYCNRAFSQMDPVKFNWFKGKGKPVILTYHESTNWQTRNLVTCSIADWIVIHDKLRDGPPAPANVRHIPYGVPRVDIRGVKVEHVVGTFGCAFPWKALYPLAWACNELGVKLKAMLSEPLSDQGALNWQHIKDSIWKTGSQAEIIEGWLPEEDVIRQLASCAVVALPFDPHAPIMGISASVRFALAAKRPLVLTRFAHFSDLYDYESEVYFEDGNLKETIEQVLSNIRWGIEKKPDRVVLDMSWDRAAKMYCELYRDALKENQYARQVDAVV
jgi:glycosyltransferase involved in cell wall biosynthesis